MVANIGRVDQIVRVVVGVALIAAALFSGLGVFDGSVVKYGALIVGFALVATGLMRTCPVYSVLGIGASEA